MEIERKWLIKKEKIPYDTELLPSVYIRQSYVSFSPTVRIREMLSNAGNEYVLTVKGKGKLSREEFELPLTEDEYRNLSGKTDGRTVCKRRYIRKREDGLTEEIDIFEGEFEGLAYLEIEFPSEKAAEMFETPSWCEFDVTTMKGFSNASLAGNGMPDLNEVI